MIYLNGTYIGELLSLGDKLNDYASKGKRINLDRLLELAKKLEEKPNIDLVETAERIKNMSIFGERITGLQSEKTHLASIDGVVEVATEMTGNSFSSLTATKVICKIGPKPRYKGGGKIVAGFEGSPNSCKFFVRKGEKYHIMIYTMKGGEVPLFPHPDPYSISFLPLSLGL